jgi:FkbM family methyltransferase
MSLRKFILNSKKLIKETKYLNTLAIFNSRRIINNLYFIVKHFFNRKKIEEISRDCHSKRIYKTKDGKSIEMYVNNYDSYTDNFFVDSEEMRINERIKKFLPNVDFIFDIGANIGNWTILQRVYYNQDVKIYSFEPAKINFEILKKNISKHNNIKIYNFALGDENNYQTLSYPINLFQYKHYYAFGGLTLKTKSLFFREKVQVIKFDTIFEKEFKNNIDSKNSGVFVKVDVEGSELEFLIGAFKTLKMLDNVVIQLEFTIKAFTYSKEDYIINYKKRLDLLKSAGFKRVFYSDRNKEFQLADINDFDLKHVFEDKIKLHKTNEYKNVYIYDVLFSK